MLNTYNSKPTWFGKFALLTTLCCLFLFLSACHDEDEFATLQVINLSPDAPSLQVNDDGFLFTDNLDYGNISPTLDLGTGEHEVVFRGELPNESTPILFSENLGFAKNSNNIVVAVNDYTSIEPFVIVQNDDPIDSSSARVRIAHLAPSAPMVDIYVTEVDADLTNSAPTATLSFKQELANINLDAGDYQVRITEAGSQSVVFDSGTVSVSGGQEISFLASDNTAHGSSPVELLLVIGSSATLVRDNNSLSQIRFIHASPDTANLDIEASSEDDDGVTTTLSLVTDLPYATSSGYMDLLPEAYTVSSFETGDTATALTEDSLTTVSGSSYSMYITDVNETIQNLSILRDQRRIATTAKLDILHAAPVVGNVDIFLTEVGEDITTIDPNFSSVGFGNSSGFLSITPGSYDLTITRADNIDNVLVTTTTVTVAAGGLYTIVALDDAITDVDPDGLPMQLLLLDDF